MNNYEVKSIGRIQNNEEGCFIHLDKEWIPGLKELDCFSHLQIIW